MKRITPTQLRAELFRVLDQVLETGEPVEIVRGTGRIVLQRQDSPRDAQPKRKPRSNPDLVVGDPDELVHFDWMPHWKAFL